MIIAVRKDVEAGLAFSAALARHPKVFGPLFVSMVRAGEIGGVLEDSLHRVADQLEKEDALRRQVRSAMVYPAVVVTVAIGVMIALVVFIVPVFAGVLKQFATTPGGASLPGMTQITVDFSHALTGYWYIFILAVGGDRVRASATGRAPSPGAPNGTRCGCASRSRSATSSRRSRSPAGRAPSPR